MHNMQNMQLQNRKRKPPQTLKFTAVSCGTPGAIRTHGLQSRRQIGYAFFLFVKRRIFDALLSV